MRLWPTKKKLSYDTVESSTAGMSKLALYPHCQPVTARELYTCALQGGSHAPNLTSVIYMNTIHNFKSLLAFYYP